MSSSTIVLITGTNVGVGYATAKVIASASSSYHVIMTGRSQTKLAAAFDELKKEEAGLKGELSMLQLDVDDEASIDAAVKKVDAQFGRLDVLINNAAIAPREGSLQSQINQSMSTNAAGPAAMAEKFHPLLLKSNSSPYSIFVTSSLGSIAIASDVRSGSYSADYIPYRMSKAALDMLVIQEHKHKSKQGLKVFAVCPGLVRSYLRGTEKEDVEAGGKAGDPMVSGKTILDIMEGKRDADVGKLVHKDGVYPW